MISLSIQTRILSEKELKELCPPGVALSEFAAEGVCHPVKARVLAVGIYSTEGQFFKLIQHSNEEVVLDETWRLVQTCLIHRTKIVGATLLSFDLPFAVWRSWALEIEVPPQVMQLAEGSFKWNPLFVDVGKAFRLDASVDCSFDDIGRTLGTGGQRVDFVPGTFAAIWKRNRNIATKWLLNEVKQPAEWAARMGIQ